MYMYGRVDLGIEVVVIPRCDILDAYLFYETHRIWMYVSTDLSLRAIVIPRHDSVDA